METMITPTDAKLFNLYTGRDIDVLRAVMRGMNRSAAQVIGIAAECKERDVTFRAWARGTSAAHVVSYLADAIDDYLV